MRIFFVRRLFKPGFPGVCSGMFREATGRRARPILQGGAEQMAVGARVKVTLRCSECKERNYFTVKNKKNTPDRLEMKKYCPRCRKYTVHNETK